MSTITDIKQAKGKNKRLHIYLDDNFACTIDEFTAFKYRLKVGQDISLNYLEEITFESELSSGFEKVVNLISKTPKTQKQVFDYLKNKGYLPKLCHAIIEKMCEYKYLNDEQYTAMYVSSYMNKYGKRKILFNLLQKGINRQIIDNALQEIDTQENAVEQLAKKYMKDKEYTSVNLNKLCRYLTSKGFSWNDISSIISKYKNGEDYESWD